MIISQMNIGLKDAPNLKGVNMKKKINNLVWDIEVKSATDIVFSDNGFLIRGCTYCGKQQIFLSDGLNEYTARRVIVHELTHAFLWSTQARMPEEYNEEELCEFMSCWGYQIIDMANEIVSKLYYPSNRRADNETD